MFALEELLERGLTRMYVGRPSAMLASVMKRPMKPVAPTMRTRPEPDVGAAMVESRGLGFGFFFLKEYERTEVAQKREGSRLVHAVGSRDKGGMYVWRCFKED